MSQDQRRQKILSLVLDTGLEPEERRAREILTDLLLDLQAVGAALWSHVHAVIRAAERVESEQGRAQ